jgi:hypothetical protein
MYALYYRYDAGISYGNESDLNIFFYGVKLEGRTRTYDYQAYVAYYYIQYTIHMHLLHIL